MAIIKNIQDKRGNILHPITEEDAVRDVENKLLSEKLIEMTSAINSKEPTIIDLETIRANATLGSTAYQKPGSGIPVADLESSARTIINNAVLFGETVGTVSD